MLGNRTADELAPLKETDEQGFGAHFLAASCARTARPIQVLGPAAADLPPPTCRRG